MNPILSEVDYERHLQDVRWGGYIHDKGHSYSDWVAIICRHLGLSIDDTAMADPVRFRKQMIRVAVAVAAVETFDRTSGKEIDQTHKGPGY